MSLPFSNGRQWPEEHFGELRRLYATGMPASRIASALNAAFRTSYSRNAVIGQIHRNVPADERFARPSPPPPVARAPHQNAGLAFKTRKFGIAGQGAVFVEPVARAARVAAPLPEAIGPTARPLAELGRQMCRWGLNDPGRGRMDEALFCGIRVKDGPYCADHHKLAHEPPQAKKRPSGAELARSLRRYAS